MHDDLTASARRFRIRSIRKSGFLCAGGPKITRAHTERAAKSAAEMAGVVESPLKCDFRDVAIASLWVGERVAAVRQAAPPDISRHRLLLRLEQAIQVAPRDPMSVRDGVGREQRIGEVRFDERLDPSQKE